MRVSPAPDSCAELTTEFSVKNLCSWTSCGSPVSTTIALPAVFCSSPSPVPDSSTIYSSTVWWASRIIRLPLASTIWSPSSAELFMPSVVSLTSVLILKLSSKAISSSSPVSKTDRTTSSIMVSKTWVVES